MEVSCAFELKKVSCVIKQLYDKPIMCDCILRSLEPNGVSASEDRRAKSATLPASKFGSNALAAFSISDTRC